MKKSRHISQDSQNGRRLTTGGILTTALASSRKLDRRRAFQTAACLTTRRLTPAQHAYMQSLSQKDDRQIVFVSAVIAAMSAARDAAAVKQAGLTAVRHQFHRANAAEAARRCAFCGHCRSNRQQSTCAKLGRVFGLAANPLTHTCADFVEVPR